MAVARHPYVTYSMCEDVHMQLARTRKHYEGAFGLVHDAYCRAGLSRPHDLGMRITPHQLAESSQVFVATLREEVICTLTLVIDSELGLPIEDVYPSEIERRRMSGARLAEVTCLADRRLTPKRFFQLFSELSRVMAQYASREGVDEIWIACHPKHAKLYERRLAFSPVGGLKDYPSVMGNPAVSLCNDLTTLPETYPAVWQKYFGESIADEVLEPQPLPGEDLNRFASIAATCVQTDSFYCQERCEVA